MAMTAATAYDQSIVASGGIINEAVMKQIWDISRIPLALTDIIGTDSHNNAYYSWTQDSLAAAVTTNKQIDGDDITATNADLNRAERVGNHSQTSVKSVNVSTRAIESDTIGKANELSYQVTMRQQELKRDCEAAMLSNNPSIAGTNAAAGQSAGLAAWLTSNTALAATPGTVGGFDGSGIVDAFTPGTKEAMSEEKVRDVAQSVYEQGGNPTVLMMIPAVCRSFSEYLFTSSARIATLTAETAQKGPAKGVGSVNVFITDFGVTLDLIPNRLQPSVSNVSQAFMLDPMHLRQSFLHSYRVEPLAKVGLSEKRLMSADWTLVVTTEEAHGMITDIDDTLAVVSAI